MGWVNFVDLAKAALPEEYTPTKLPGRTEREKPETIETPTGCTCEDATRHYSDCPCWVPHGA